MLLLDASGRPMTTTEETYQTGATAGRCASLPVRARISLSRLDGGSFMGEPAFAPAGLDAAPPYAPGGLARAAPAWARGRLQPYGRRAGECGRCSSARSRRASRSGGRRSPVAEFAETAQMGQTPLSLARERPATAGVAYRARDNRWFSLDESDGASHSSAR